MKDDIEDVLMEYCEPDTGLLTIGKYDHDVFREAMEQVLAKARERIGKLAKKRDTTEHWERLYGGAYNQAINDVLEALQDNK